MVEIVQDRDNRAALGIEFGEKVQQFDLVSDIKERSAVRRGGGSVSAVPRP